MLPLAGNRHMHVTNNEKNQQPLRRGISHMAQLHWDIRTGRDMYVAGLEIWTGLWTTRQV